MDSSISRADGALAARKLLVLVLILIVASGGALLFWPYDRPHGDIGAYLIPQGNMTDEEARAMLDAQAEASRITISIRPDQELVDGKLHMNFVVPAGNNGLSERLEIEQGGLVVYRSGIVEPGRVIDWGYAPRARVGTAVATVYAVNEAGEDSGNPVSVEIEIVES